MADFYAPQFNPPPNLLASYLQGQMAPLQMQQAQQQVQQGGLQIDQLRLALQNQRMYQQYAQGLIGTPGSQANGAQSAAGPTGGVQNGPQSGVSQTPNSGASMSGSYDGSGGGYAPGGYTPSTLQALAILRGDDPLKTAQGIQDYQVQQRKLQAQGPLSLLDSVSGSPHADVVIKNNPSLQQMWVKGAPQLGLNPFTDLTPANARSVATFMYNNVAGGAGLPPKPMPVQLQNVDLGQGETGQINPITGKKEGDLTERRPPTYTLVDKYDPATNSTIKVPVQTGGVGMGGVNPSSGVTTGGAVPGSAPGFNMGQKAPDDANLKAAMFATEMRSGMNTLNRMEGSGFNLSPKARAMIMSAATSEDSGALSQLLNQEAMVHGMTPQEQTYTAALMPVLQAAGHDQSGARLTTSQIRQNVESLLPVDVGNKEALAQIHQNRQGFYNGLLTQAGSAAQLPQFKGTIGADLAQAQESGKQELKVIGGKTYFRQGGKWYAE